MEILNGLKPEELRLHMLVAAATTTLSQKIRLYLLMERKERAKEVVEDLRELRITQIKAAFALIRREASNLGMMDVSFLCAPNCRKGGSKKE